MSEASIWKAVISDLAQDVAADLTTNEVKASKEAVQDRVHKALTYLFERNEVKWSAKRKTMAQTGQNSEMLTQRVTNLKSNLEDTRRNFLRTLREKDVLLEAIEELSGPKEHRSDHVRTIHVNLTKKLLAAFGNAEQEPGANRHHV